MVLGAFKADNYIYFVVTDVFERSDITATNTKLMRAEYSGDVPENRDISGIDMSCIPVIDVSSSLDTYLKEIYPDTVARDLDKPLGDGFYRGLNDWLMYENKAYCKDGILRNKGGKWVAGGTALRYNVTFFMRVLYASKRRHQREEFFENITINLNTDESFYECRLYVPEIGGILTKSAVFDKNLGVWRDIRSNLQTDIISVRKSK